MEINNHKPYSRCRVWRCDVTTSNWIQDGGALVVHILVFDLRVQLQHCTYQRKTLLFALIKVSTFISKREISCLSSPLKFLYWTSYGINVNSTLWRVTTCIFSVLLNQTYLCYSIVWTILKLFCSSNIRFKFKCWSSHPHEAVISEVL